MSIITPNIDSSPYVGVRNVQGKVRVKTHDDAPWLKDLATWKTLPLSMIMAQNKHSATFSLVNYPSPKGNGLITAQSY